MGIIDPGSYPASMELRCQGNCRRMLEARQFDFVKRDGTTSRYCFDCRRASYFRRFSMYSERKLVWPFCEARGIPKVMRFPWHLPIEDWNRYSLGFMRAVAIFAKTPKMRTKAGEFVKELGGTPPPVRKVRGNSKDIEVTNREGPWTVGYWHGVAIFCKVPSVREEAVKRYFEAGGEGKDYGSRRGGDSTGAGGLLGAGGDGGDGAADLDRGGPPPTGTGDSGRPGEVGEDDGSCGIGCPS